MAAIARTDEVDKDIQSLLNLFLSKDFHPLADEVTNDQGFCYEGDGEEVADGSGECDLQPRDTLLKECGRKLAHIGDEILHKRSEQPRQGTRNHSPIERVRSLFKRLADIFTSSKVEDSRVQNEKEEAWTTFEGIIQDSVGGTCVDDAYHELGTLLMTANGLSDLGDVVTDLGRTFSQRYVQDHNLASIIRQQGGWAELLRRDQ